MQDKNNNKIIVIIGPTATGKTNLAVDLAYKYNGEIISADSRQVYRGMDIGSGKDLAEYTLVKKIKGKRKKIKIPYHLIDVVSPNTEFNLAKFQKMAQKSIKDILARGKTPIIAGGTGLYTQSLVENYNLSKEKIDKNLRNELDKKTVSELLAILKKHSPKKAEKLNNSDKQNKRRLIRYIEISSQEKESDKQKKSEYKFLLIGINLPREVIRQKIYKRLIERLEKENMIEEVEKLHKVSRVSWKRLEKFGLEYRYIALYLQGKLEYKEIVEKLNIAICQFAKRQMTWYRRWERQGGRIFWIEEKGDSVKLVDGFLKR